MAEAWCVAGEEPLELINFQSGGGIPGGRRLAPDALEAMVMVSEPEDVVC